MHIGVFKLTTDFLLLRPQHAPMLALKTDEKPDKRRCQRVVKKHSIFMVILVLFWCSLGVNLARTWRPKRPKTMPKSAQEAPKTAPETLKVASRAYFLGFWWIFWKQEPQDLPKRPPEPSKITWELLTKPFETTLVHLYVGYIFSTFGLFKTIWW